MNAALDPRAIILARIERYTAATGVSEWRLGLEAVHNANYARRLRAGKGASLTVVERAEAYMQADLARRGLPNLEILSRG
ncbi:hypothetical protein [Roseomonas sp. BN140053]|uniref:hypothetical protein n=1 Tax=Roseomonas sp. BN140053 TaxID=3391898 RepID=UPI0039ECAB8F